MYYFKTCKYCGCNLDPGEKCDCQDEKEPLKPTKVKRAYYKYIAKQYNTQGINFITLIDGRIAYVMDRRSRERL